MFPKGINFDTKMLNSQLQSRDVSKTSPSSQSQPTIKTQAEDELELSDFHPAKARKILNERIIAGINSVLEADGIGPVQSANADDFTPEKVAERIMGFIDSAMDLARLNGADDAELNKMFEQAKQGVDQGFKEATDILKGYGVLEGKIAEDIEDTYSRIQDGFGELESKYFGSESKSVANTSKSSLQAANRSREESFSLEVETNDGDVITLTIENSNSASASRLIEQSDGQTSMLLQSSRSSSSQINLTIEGDLDDDEKAAINELVGQIEDLAEDFYSGKTRKAFQHAQQLGYDAGELSGFALEMSYTETRSAVSAYEEVSQIEPDYSETPKATASVEPLSSSEKRTIGEFFDKADKVLRAADSLFPKPDDYVKNLFAGIARISERFEAFNDQLKEKQKGYSFANLIDGMASKTESSNT